MKQRWLWIVAGVIVLALIVSGLVIYNLFFRGSDVELARLNGGIAFTSDMDGSWDVFTLSPEGELKNLTKEGGDSHEYFPSYAFDGNMMNMITSRGGAVMGPAQVRPDGTDFRVLDLLSAIISVAQEQRFQWDPSYSKDGWQLWVQIINLNLDLFVQSPTGDKIRLTQDGVNGARDWFATWSPDNQFIIYSSNRIDNNENLYIISREGGEPQRLTDFDYSVLNGAFSLDGKTILFISNEDEILMTGEMPIYLMNPDGSNIRPIGDEIFSGDAQVSPDGTQMVYMSNETGNWHIYLMNVDGTNKRQLTETGNNLFPVWETIPADSAPEATTAP